MSSVSSVNEKYEAVIGLEVHAQMLTATKIFCACPNKFGSEPNSQTCPVCTGMPGVLPVLNTKALEFAIRTGLAMDCEIAPYSRFARKNYFYPDLPKGYQISQFEQPICEHGHVDLILDSKPKRVGITRIHMEDDAGKNLHDGKSGYSRVDLNRTGTPLMEIVSEPDIRSPQEAAIYMKKLRTIVRYIGVCDGNMEQGSLRCDANISIRQRGVETLGTRVELKNINSFKFVERAIQYEILRQIELVEDGGSVVQETRLFDTSSGVTVSMRSKEEAHDYRYFPDPDLVPMVTDEATIESIRAALPELPDARSARFTKDMGLGADLADYICSERPLADWFEQCVKLGADAKQAANWVQGELVRIMNDNGHTIEDSQLQPAQLAGMLKLVDNGTISGKIAKTVFSEMYDSGKDAETVVNEKGLVQITDEGALQKAVLEVIAASPDEVERFKAGDKKLQGFFVGQVMKATRGKANPKSVNELLKKHLA